MQTKRRTRRDATRLYRLCVVDGALDETRVRRVADHLGRARRRGALALLAYFARRVRLDRELHSARVVSAVPLPEDLRARVQANVSRTYGKHYETSFTEDPALIGGMRLQVGSDVYDGSVRGRLAEIEARIGGD